MSSEIRGLIAKWREPFDGDECRAASVEDGEAGRLADKLDELCTYPDGHSISDAGEPWGATCGTLRTAAKLLRALSRGVPEDAVGSHFYAACERACGELPVGWEVRVCLENGSGTVELCSPDGFSEYMDVDDDDRLTAEVNAAVDAAIAAQRKEGG